MAMSRNRFLALFFYFAVVSEATRAYFWDSRKLLDMAPKDNATRTAPVSPPSSSVSSVNNSDSLPVNGNKKQSELPAPNNSSSNVDSKVLNNPGSGSSPSVSETGKKPAEPTKNENKASPQYRNGENCDGVPDNMKCRDLKKLVACIRSNLIESRDLAVLVQNEGEDSLKVNVTGGNFFKELEILKHHTERIIVPLTTGKSMKLILDAGNGECVIYTSLSPPVSGGNFFLRLPSFDQLVTPVNGAYFLILIVLIFGGSWACCKFRRRKPGGVPYQELEMALPESSSAINVETAEGWDEGWDDDWDEGNAVKSPGGRRLGSISANGLTARSNKDGWENDWDV